MEDDNLREQRRPRYRVDRGPRPGLRHGGVRHARPDLGGWWSIDGKSSNLYVMGNRWGGGSGRERLDHHGDLPTAQRTSPWATTASGNRVNFPGGITSGRVRARGLSAEHRQAAAHFGGSQCEQCVPGDQLAGFTRGSGHLRWRRYFDRRIGDEKREGVCGLDLHHRYCRR